MRMKTHILIIVTGSRDPDSRCGKSDGGFEDNLKILRIRHPPCIPAVAAA